MKLSVSWMGRFFYYLLPVRKQIVLDNIDRVFKNTILQKEKTHLAKAFYSHAATTLKEILSMRRIRVAQIDALIELHGVEHLRNAQSKGRGVLLLSGHTGNWEFFSLIGLLNVAPPTEPFYVIRRPIHNKRLEKMLFERMSSCGIELINSHGALTKINQVLKNNGKIVFVMDQHADTKNKLGIPVDFFDIKAGTYSSLAYFAQKYNAPVIPLSSHRTPNGKHVFEFHPEVIWEPHSDKKQAIYNNTLRYNQVLEQFVMEHPEQWWWVHRRWKL
ncbi:lysophospholipid acyltransferase family protein [Legionella shakespearei]|nr:lysophospholipid acyltransferase family protein [Legionella shakespearei]